MFRPGLLQSPLGRVLPFTMFVFPALLEEAFFRGLLIPHPHTRPSRRRLAWWVGCSTVVFTAWHPLNAWLINPGARTFFYDPWFLAIVLLLGVTCGITYVVSRSLWVPVVIHWGTVLMWVFFLGGRNLVREAAIYPPNLKHQPYTKKHDQFCGLRFYTNASLQIIRGTTRLSASRDRRAEASFRLCWS